MSLESAAELYVHAIAIEHEAAERYAEFAGRMADQGNQAVATLFRMLSSVEAKHLDALKRRTAGIALPPLASDYSWLDDGAPETAAREQIFGRMTQRQALSMALHNEKRSRAFFEHAARTTTDPAVRSLATEMALEESEHVALIERMLDCTPDPSVDWAASVFGAP